MDKDIIELQNINKGMKNLEVMSIEALSEYIIDLEKEVERARSAIKAKEAARSVADDVFRA